MRIQLSELVENIVGEEEIARYEQFLLFPQCLLMRQNEYLWSKGLICLQYKSFENTVGKGEKMLEQE